ncbi:MAG: 16S rRNA (uracil(1498)-N(3))-methyltransferase [Alysiella sp.]|uniref:16S rRNA (uracil(1498)-N(3))-methyltransferase n=1 Tax=Alysiella sp. TaxID=1872483 RepID=UPI0026DC80B7|nr:16S rRNA (uracil(1498)-N(3))-methyltransferase [Alysiella sp.]MDO4434301.1 16S rRNA (uracil(1498)-N(3))-methyltransferase [Alysiella sp.]
MPRFYLPPPLIENSTLMLPENIVRHIQVLRLKTGDNLTLFNSDGCEYPAQLSELGKRHAACLVGQKHLINRESPLKIHLIQAISSGERMDFTLQKSVELGVSSIFPIISERCVVRLTGERAERKVQRWQEIVIAACEQSGRNTVPQVLPIMDFSGCLKMLPESDLKLLMSLNHAHSLRDFSLPQSVQLMIGPEGGWTAAEENAARAAGFQAITLGQRVLRTETTSLAAIAAMQTLWGDFV